MVALSLQSGGPKEWMAAVLAAGAALLTRSLPLTMATGIAAIWLLRHSG